MLLRPAGGLPSSSLMGRYGDELARIADRGQAELALAHGLKLQKLDALMRNIVQQSFDGILSVGAAGRIDTANQAALRMFGCRSADLVGRHMLQLFPDLPHYRPLEATRGGRGARLEGMARRHDGGAFPVEVSLRPTVVQDQRLLIAIVRDITAAKAQERRLRHQAVHDSLTGLPNRLLLKDRLAQALRSAARAAQPLALLLVDLDRFKEVNDTLGHHFGDLLLVHFARRLQDCIRESDTIARLGGDEFAILLPAASAVERAWSVSGRIVQAVQRPFEVAQGLRLEVGVSIGIAMFPEHADDQARLLQCADVAMYAAKKGAGPVQLYDREKDRNTIRHLTLSGALREAIEGGQLSFDFQPKLDLLAGTIRSVEALARWRHPAQGAILPDEFIPHAEQTGLIQPFTRWSFDAALAQLAEWRDAGLDISVAVNLSTRSLHDEKLPETIASLLRKWRVDPGLLTLELTESAVMLDPDGAQRNLFRLHELGLSLSIDDFGTGYSSLSHLQRLPLHELKIDKSFVNQMIDNDNDLVIVRSTIDLAHNLGLNVVAEGIESEQHLAILQELGCDLGQGFFVSHPLPVERLTAWFEESPWQLYRTERESAPSEAARRRPRKAPGRVPSAAVAP
jgi:diguanylate cyclase (GGDEF)-like protein/PAS domain S-box-containing protein